MKNVLAKAVQLAKQKSLEAKGQKKKFTEAELEARVKEELEKLKAKATYAEVAAADEAKKKKKRRSTEEMDIQLVVDEKKKKEGKE
uniref:Uncharacterized protein n=1 Tax=Meloidogyne javanica TaxID=6303 RepID=A0A915LTW5_MELJA